MHHVYRLDVHLRSNSTLSLVIIASLKVAVGRVPVKGRQRRLISIDRNAQDVVGI